MGMQLLVLDTAQTKPKVSFSITQSSPRQPKQKQVNKLSCRFSEM